MKKLLTCLLTVLLLISFLTLPVSANSAQTRWRGVAASGAVVTETDCPLEVEKETLTFDLLEFPENYYGSLSDYLGYTGKVTAEYTFRNPAEYDVTATLVFPFGKYPDYIYSTTDDAESQSAKAADLEKYGVAVNGESAESKLRHTLSDPYSDFDPETDIARLHDSYMEDSFFKPDLTVTKQTYAYDDPSLGSPATAAFTWIPSDDTKVLLYNQCGGQRDAEDNLLICTWVDTEEGITLYVFGEKPFEPEWKIFENGACEKEIEGSITLTASETMTLKDFALQKYSAESGISESDWYNAMVEDLKRSDKEWGSSVKTESGETETVPGGVLSCCAHDFDLTGSLLRWYEYELVVPAGETVTNTVTAPMYPAIDSAYVSPVFTYTYLLSPAKGWADFKLLDIRINTPSYLIECSVPGFEKTGEGYALLIDSLPEEELVFKLCAEENPVRAVPSYTFHFLSWITLILSLLTLALIAGSVAAVIVIRRKK